MTIRTQINQQPIQGSLNVTNSHLYIKQVISVQERIHMKYVQLKNS